MGNKAKFLKKLHWQLGLVLLILFSVLSSAPKLQASSNLESAKDYLSQGDVRSAIIELKNALQEDPDQAEARFLLGART